MSDRTSANRLRAHRRKAGLSQHELGKLLGYKRSWQISRHERSQTAPPLLMALAYEHVFQLPISVLFGGMSITVAHLIESNLAAFEKDLQEQTQGRPATGTARKLRWLTERRNITA